MSHETIVHGIQALALGFSIGLILLLIRRHAPGSRLRVWVLLAGFAGGAYLVMQIMGVTGTSTASRIVLSATIILGTNMVLQLLNLLLWDYLLKRRGDMHIPRLVIDIINFIVLAIVAVIVLNRVFGMKLTAFLVTSTVLSAVIGLSLQDILGNLFAGLALQMERPYMLGEWISVGDREGVVSQMNWRSLTIRTRQGDHVTIPNATIAKEIVTNFSRPSMEHRCTLNVPMAYEYAPETVRKVVLEAMAEAKGVLRKPLTEVFLKQFDDFSIDYEARFWISDFTNRPAIEDAVRSRIWYGLQRAGLSVPFPIRHITMKTVSEDQEVKTRQDRRNEMILELKKIDLFDSLDATQIEGLADSSVKLLYGCGEILVRQGGGGDSLFLITSGEVDVSVSAAPGESTHLATLGKGTYFGEMSLLTGEPRSATITANTETEVIVVEKAGLSRLLETGSAILEPLSAMLEKRLAERVSRVKDHEHSKAGARKPDQKENLLSRIRDFFGLG